MKILMTGGSGLLGKELLKHDSSLVAPSHADMDITDIVSVRKALELYKPDAVLHCAAATKPPQHNEHPEVGIEANIIGTANVARGCIEQKIRLVYTSTDYLYLGEGLHAETEGVLPPYNFAWSKLGGECSVMMCPNSLVLRLSFGPVPFPWEKVYEGQYNSKLYVDEIAPLILAATKSTATGIMNVGGPKNSLSEYASRTREGIQTIPKPDWVPADTSLDLSKMKKELGIDDESKLIKHNA